MKAFVDANLFLRFFTSDDIGQHAIAARLFRAAAAGEVELLTGPPVLFEVAWTLRSAYGLKADKVLSVLRAIAGLPGLTLSDSEVVDHAMLIADEQGGEFADAYIWAQAQAMGADAVATLNIRDFKRLGATVYEFPVTVGG